MKINNHMRILLILQSAFLLTSNVQSEEQEVAGGDLYRAYCAQCHGLEGDGYGVNSYDIEVAPRDHTDTSEMMARTDEDLIKTIKYGGKSVNKSVLMPNWEGNLTDDEINLLVGYLREICCKGGE